MPPLPPGSRFRQGCHPLLALLWMPVALALRLRAALHHLTLRPLWRALFILMPLAVGLGLWVAAPLAWARQKLIYEAQPLMRRTQTDDDLAAALPRLAARAGLRHPVPSPEAFRIRDLDRAGADLRELAFDIPQHVILFDRHLATVRLRGRVVASRPDPDAALPSPESP